VSCSLSDGQNIAIVIDGGCELIEVGYNAVAAVVGVVEVGGQQGADY